MNTIIKKIVLTFSIMLLTIPAYAYDFEANGLHFDIISIPDGTCRLVSRNTDNICDPYIGDFVIPESVEYKNRQFTVTEIGEYAFVNQQNNLRPIMKANTQLKSVKIPNTIKSIGSHAFDYCSSLKTIEIPNSVIKIDWCAFIMCTSLQSITIPNSVVYIGESAFSNCTSLQSVIIPNSVHTIDAEAFYGCTSLQSVIIPNSVTDIKNGTFRNCTSLQSVIIPNSVHTIGARVFQGCTSLQSVIIPNSVTQIYDWVFNGCENLKKVTFCSGSPVLIFSLKGSSGGYSTVFDGCKDLTIEIGRIIGCGYIYQFEKGIPKSLFSNIITLKVLKESDPSQIALFTFIPNLLFEDGYDLTKVSANFNIFSELKSLTLESATPPVCPKFSNDQYLNVILYVPIGTLETYQKADGWKYFFDIREVEISTGVKEVQSGSRREIGRYDINGNKVDENFKGITIVKFSDGSTKKFINR